MKGPPVLPVSGFGDFVKTDVRADDTVNKALFGAAVSAVQQFPEQYGEFSDLYRFQNERAGDRSFQRFFPEIISL
ncbi:MAG: hypothetical protein R2861_13570 [Desulfobacterales bacterium]